MSYLDKETGITGHKYKGSVLGWGCPGKYVNERRVKELRVFARD